MAQRIEAITHHVFAFDDAEIARILDALYENEDYELHGSIFEEMNGKECVDFCVDCGETF